MRNPAPAVGPCKIQSYQRPVQYLSHESIRSRKDRQPGVQTIRHRTSGPSIHIPDRTPTEPERMHSRSSSPGIFVPGIRPAARHRRGRSRPARSAAGRCLSYLSHTEPAAMVETDATGTAVVHDGPARRIVSLVSSQTEGLHGLGLGAEVVGITRFCMHPAKWPWEKPRVGGTKDVCPERVRQSAAVGGLLPVGPRPVRCLRARLAGFPYFRRSFPDGPPLPLPARAVTGPRKTRIYANGLSTGIRGRPARWSLQG